tara:strand:+ start:2174 stop:2518 length:345 start_codon:yes stop_codon:yes gene_type:complete
MPSRWSLYSHLRDGGDDDTASDLRRLKHATLREVNARMGIDVRRDELPGLFDEAVPHELFENAVRVCVLVALEGFVAQGEKGLREGWRTFYAAFDPRSFRTLTRSVGDDEYRPN